MTTTQSKPFRLCINHQLELWKHGYGLPEAIKKAVPVAYLLKHCAICNGTWKVNQELSKIELE